MRILLAGMLGGIAMFVWTSIAHVALPLREAGINEIPNESVVLSAMQSSIGEKTGHMFSQVVNRRSCGRGASCTGSRNDAKINERPCRWPYPRARSDLQLL